MPIKTPEFVNNTLEWGKVQLLWTLAAVVGFSALEYAGDAIHSGIEHYDKGAGLAKLGWWENVLSDTSAKDYYFYNHNLKSLDAWIFAVGAGLLGRYGTKQLPK